MLDSAGWNWGAFRPLVESFACVSIFGGLLSAILVWRYPWVRRNWLPERTPQKVGWDGGDIVVAGMLSFLCPSILAMALSSTGFFDLIYGQEPDAGRRSIWVGFLAMPFSLALILTALYLRSHIRPTDLGLSLRRWPANCVVGFVSYFLATPVVLGFFALLKLVPGGKVHSLVRAGEQGLSALEWPMLFLSTAVAAPIIEELLFRGLILGWLKRASLAGHVSFAAIFGLISVTSAVEDAKYVRGPLDLADHYLAINWPRVLATYVLVGGYGFYVWRLKGQQNGTSGLAMFGSAMAFGLVHPSWPDALPLILLGLVLAWVTQRTQSLVAAIVLHSLFNLVAGLGLLFTALHKI